MTLKRTLTCRTLASFVLPALCAVGSVGIAQAHDDDGKIRDRQKPVRATAYRADDPKSDGNVAGTFDSNGIVLKSWLPLNTLSAGAQNGNSCWGYVGTDGKEYAIIGLYDGTAIVDITVPGNAQLKAFVAGPASLWRDVRTHSRYCYAASEGGGGIQVISLANINSGSAPVVNTITAPTTTTAATHTLAIDNVSAFLYRAGGGSNGLRMYSLADPSNPAYVGQWSNIYIHEAQVVTYTSGPYAGKQIAFCFGGGNGGYANTGLYIVDVTNKAAPTQLGFVTYPGARFCHQGWLDEERRYMYINDELDEGDTVSVTTTIVVDVSNLTAPIFVNAFNNGNPAIGHNMYVKGNYLYEANYRAGVRVFDLSVSRTSPPEVAYFDTYPGSDAANFNGLWNIWPYFPSGTVIGSDLERGLFVWTIGGPVATFSVANAPVTVNPAGGSTVDVTITAGQGQTLNTSTARMKVTVGTTTTTVPLSPLGGNVFRGTFPATPCTSTVSYVFEVENNQGEASTDNPRTAFSAVAVVTAVDENFEAVNGWVGGVAGDTATSGQWVRVDPVGTTAQPEDDHSTTGTVCWVTGQGTAGGAAGAADVDGGTTTLLSPVFDMSQMDEPTIEYWYWYSNNLGGAPGLDSMPVEITNNGGTSWVLIEDIATNNSLWTKRSWRVRDFITPTANVRVRFVARDLNQGSLIEAGVDDFKIVNVDCTATIPGDLNGDGLVNAADLAGLLSAWGATSGAADINGDGTVNATDLAILISNWNG
ncbi:MAG: choice-of-anchor B family protein [Planctomycetaceae bacterium]|nr:choice-of-anchor B family protein [Planctomycetaceae bacterium]